MVPERPEAAVPERVSAPPEVTITRRVGHGLTLALLTVGQVLATASMFAIELTSGSRLLSRAAFAGYLASSAVAWWPAANHPCRAIAVMAGGCAALFGLLVLAGSQGWLGA